MDSSAVAPFLAMKTSKVYFAAKFFEIHANNFKQYALSRILLKMCVCVWCIYVCDFLILFYTKTEFDDTNTLLLEK